MNEQYHEAMGKALFLANRARETGDVPVGAVVVDENGRIIGRGWNCREANHDPAGHAEIVALREAGRARGTWRLTGCTLIVTLEPCTMCAGAILASRIDRVVFGAWDPKAGAAGSLRDVLRDARMPHPTEVIGGVLAQEAAMQLRSFFLGCRTPDEMPVVQAPVHEPSDLVAPIVVPYEEDEAPEQVHEKATNDEGVPAQLITPEAPAAEPEPDAEEPAPEPEEDAEEPAPEPEHVYGAGADTAIAAAQEYLGVPYVWAGESFDGVDCSGLTMLAYQSAGVDLTHSSRVQYGEGEQVDLADAQPGDLVFWSSDGSQEGIYHVAIYLGDDQMIEAPTFGIPVRITEMRYADIMPYAVRP